MPRTRRTLATLSLILLSGTALGMYAPTRATPPLTWSGATPNSVMRADDDAVRLAVTAFGRSGKLRAVVTDPNRRLELPLEWAGADPFDAAYTWTPQAGTQIRLLGGGGQLAGGLVAPSTAGVWRLHLRGNTWAQEMADLHVITRVPFSDKRGGYLNGYRIGEYATEADGRTDRYAPPAGFIEVTPDNQDLYVSEHFRLRNFLTKDQFAVWPKYLALDLRLIDKLELVIQELNAMGVRAEHVAVMSGFRTPAYNGPGEGGRARLSRHTYGDASDVWVDNDRDGYIDDLNGDGRRDTDDVRVMLRAVDRVESRHPELVGGAGVYDGNGAHGPFIHIDARGYMARW
ncbi:MAG TPA: hypothetical protein VF665_18940 [Longimicrobium sp.]|jgi:hypothetical protein|uniref:hypothetical protein n=1 Tax=Longimicrobium sp. TaxID=2029185 RepID=UPI002ED906B3